MNSGTVGLEASVMKVLPDLPTVFQRRLRGRSQGQKRLHGMILHILALGCTLCA